MRLHINSAHPTSSLLTLLDAHCSAAALFLEFSFLPNDAPWAGLDYFGVIRGSTMGVSEQRLLLSCFSTNCFEIITHSKRDNVLDVELHFFYQSGFFFFLVFFYMNLI